MRRLYIVGTGRCGTNALSRYYKEKGFNVTHERLMRARELSNRRWDGAESRERVKEILSEYLEQLNKEQIEIESNCLLWNLVDLIGELEPDSNFIWVVREPVSCITSLYRTQYGEPRVGRPFFRPIKGMHDWSGKTEKYTNEKKVRNCVLAYISRNEMIQAYLNGMPKTRWSRFNFEDIIKDMSFIDSKVVKYFGKKIKTTPLIRSNEKNACKIEKNMIQVDRIREIVNEYPNIIF